MEDEALFSRQRRNLILISVFLLFAVYLHLSISKLNFLGNEFPMSQPRLVWPMLGILWLYFLWRYWQVFSWAAYWSGVQEHFKKRLVQKAWEILESAHAGERLRRLDPRNVMGQQQSTTMGQVDHAMIALFSDRALVTLWYVPEKEVALFATPQNMDIPIGKDEGFKGLYLRSLFGAQVNTPLFTEHLLPFLVAFIALVCGVWTWVSTLRCQ